MAQPVIQASFNTGEWAPSLNARVDLQKYHSAAALLENFFVDYRGGASSRPGTEYIVTAFISDHPVRLIPFQASFQVGYILEFGDFYIRFIFNGAQIMLSGNPYTINSPYKAQDLAKLKFAQQVDKLILVHPNYPPYALTLITATNWTLTPITFGSTIAVPVGSNVATTLAAGTVNYAYVVTAVDINGQESGPCAPLLLNNTQDIRTVAGTNYIHWFPVTGAHSYNIYKAEPAYGASIFAGVTYGFIGNMTAPGPFADSNIAPDYSQGPPVPQNPFVGAGVDSIAVTAPGAYTSVPNVTVDPPANGSTATASAILQANAVTIAAGGAGFSVGKDFEFPFGIILVAATVDGSGAVTSFQPFTFYGCSPGYISAGPTPTNPIRSTSDPNVEINVTSWGVGIVSVTGAGAGYTTVPNVTFSGGGGATAVATLLTSNAGNPSAVSFFQQRMVLAAPPNAVQTFYMSQPGLYNNFDISNPLQDNDAITGSIVAGQLNEIKSMISVPTGMMVLTSQGNWLVNGGAANVAITPADATANAHSYIGSSDVPPIVSNFDILFVQSKGSVVRDLTYNFYAAIFTGTDITVLSSHLFYGHTITEWAWAQEPFKLVWAVRDDGILLSLTFMKEQEFIGWTHHDTQGQFRSVATVTEQVGDAAVDAIYFVVDRVVNGQNVKYIERLAERIFPNGAKDAWCVDAGLQYNGAPTTSFTGAQHLAGKGVAGLADGVPFVPFIMPVSGSFTLPTPASKVTVGLQYTCRLQTLAIDLGEPTAQGKMKVIPAVTVRIENTLGLQIGSTFDSLVYMKDLLPGNVGSATNTIVTDLVTGDAMTKIDARYTVPGQYCIQQTETWPATILGVIPQVSVGDTIK